jgi:GNAT superfamily N-acetyltransferase
MARTRIEVLVRPGRTLSVTARGLLQSELIDVAAPCFDELPRYGVLGDDAAPWDDAVIALARDERGRLLAFTAAQILPIDGVGEMLHLGLTCVHPEHRGARLTHPLLARTIQTWLLRNPLRGAWVTNVASVLSSLANVALHFESVWPSPFEDGPPTPQHTLVAAGLSDRWRGRLHLDGGAPLDLERFVLVGANRGSVFQKASHDARYHHRDPELTRWYRELADLDGGDAVLQVGRVSIPGLVRYGVRNLVASVPGLRRLVSRPAMRPVPALSRAA